MWLGDSKKASAFATLYACSENLSLITRCMFCCQSIILGSCERERGTTGVELFAIDADAAAAPDKCGGLGYAIGGVDDCVPCIMLAVAPIIPVPVPIDSDMCVCDCGCAEGNGGGANILLGGIVGGGMGGCGDCGLGPPYIGGGAGRCVSCLPGGGPGGGGG